MTDKISNKLVLITGASSGIGAETAKELARRNAIVILLARNETKLKKVSDEIQYLKGKAYYYPVDLSKNEEVVQVCHKIKTQIGIPDIIVNNAGSGKWLTIEETSEKELKEMIALPFLAAFYVTKALLPDMKKRNSGHIINLTSDASFLPKGCALGYSVARYALRGFSDGLRNYLVNSNLVVSLAVFGKVASSFWENNPGSEERVPKATPFMPTLTTSEVANYLLKIIETEKRILIKPTIFKILFWFFHRWPDQISKNMK